MMPEQVNLVRDGVDRFNAAFESLGDEVERLQREFQSRRKSFEKQMADGRKKFEKRTRKQVNRIESELRKNPLVKRARSLQSDVAKQLEDGASRLLSALQIASKTDLQRVDRKLNQLTRKLKDIERARKANGETAEL
jgi:hypothetical protein